MIIFTGSKNEIYGGFHYQVLRVRGRLYSWGEHLWGAALPERPSFFLRAMAIIKAELEGRGVSRIFLEFNDPLKMTLEEIEIDKLAGLPPDLRVWMWAMLKAYELVVKREKIGKYKADKTKMRKIPLSISAPCAQPAMGKDAPPVKMLTLAFISLDGEMTSMDREEYWELLSEAYSTIPGVDPATDETCVAIRKELDEGPEVYEFRPMYERFEPLRAA